MSGLLFTWVLEPLLIALEAQCRSDTVVRACADDIGASVTRFDEVVVLESIFTRWSRCSNLRLKPVKCNIVPLWKAWSMQVVEVLRDSLRCLAPSWDAFQIVPAAKYLGFLMGPAVSLEMQWASVICGYKTAAHNIVASDIAPSAVVHHHNIRAMPKLLYLSQLLPPPSSIASTELDVMNKLFRFPGRAVPRAFFSRCDQFGLMKPRLPSVATRSALIGAALSGRIRFADEIETLKRACEWDIELPIIFSKDCFWPLHWESPPFAVNLSEVLSGSRVSKDCPHRFLREPCLRHACRLRLSKERL